MDLRDKVALVTGASMGIGRQISLDLARAGAVVVGVARGVEALGQLLHLLQRASPRSEVTPLDVAEADAVREVVPGVVSRHATRDIMYKYADVEKRRSLLEYKSYVVVRA